MFTMTLIALVVGLYIFTRFCERRTRRLLAELPSYPSLPFVGNFYQFAGGSKAMFRILTKICETIERHNKPVVVWAGSYPIIVLCDPEDVKLVTNTFIEKPYFYDFSKPLVGNGLFSAPGSLWKRNIKKIVGTGFFTTAAVQTYQEKFSACSFEMLEQLRKKAGEGPFDATEIIVTTTLDAICQTAIGSEVASDPDFVRTYYKSFSRFLSIAMDRGLNLLLHPDVVFQRTPMYQESMENVAVLHEVTNAVISRINQRGEDMKEPHNFVNGASQANSFYESLLILHQKDPSSFTMEQLFSEIHTVILAGQKTVATTLVFLFLVIGHYEDVQKKLYKELKEIYGGSKRRVTTEDLGRMPFCEAVINETLRLYPPGPLVLRCADSDLTLKSCTIPKGATCAIAVWGQNRCSRVWGAAAGEFRPERWLQPHCPGDTAAFAPFSYGKRACIGKKYAMAFLKTLVAQCVRDLEFKSDITHMELKIDIVLKPISNHLIQVRKRE